MKLQVRELVVPLSTEEPGLLMPERVPAAEPSVWHDSSMDLERGLDVVELSVDLPLSNVPVPSLPAALSTRKGR